MKFSFKCHPEIEWLKERSQSSCFYFCCAAASFNKRLHLDNLQATRFAVSLALHFTAKRVAYKLQLKRALDNKTYRSGRLSIKTTARRILELDTLGSFDFSNLLISIDSLDVSSIDIFHSAMKSNDISVLREIVPLFYHEFRHFLDATSTLWGMKHMKLMSDAYSCNPELGGLPKEYYKAKVFHNHLKSLRYPEVFTRIENGVEPRRPWTSQIDVGIGFSSTGHVSPKQHLNIQFFNASDQPLVRAPISPVSILESSAMCAEINLHASMIDSMEDEFKTVEKVLYGKKATREMYQPEFVEYFSCVHTLGGNLGSGNGLILFRICEYICRVVLNISSVLAIRLANSENLKDILEVPSGHSFELMIKRSLYYHDLGVLFFLISLCLPKSVYESPSKMESGMEQALVKLGTSLAEVAEFSVKEADEIREELSVSQISSLKAFGLAGFENLRNISLGQEMPDMLKLLLPPVYLGDGQPLVMFGAPMNRLQEIDIDYVFMELYKGHKWVEEFSESCFL
jgi:hypothetical protein